MMKLTIITVTHYRSHLLAHNALPSILAQTDPDFEWVIINDGPDPETRSLVIGLNPSCSLALACASARIVYREMEHPLTGFGLCHGRNLGLASANGAIVAYLDDDNALSPTYVEETKKFFATHPMVKSSMVQQQRRRDILQAGQVAKQGKPFVSPQAGAEVQDLIRHNELFDSNGFAHYRENAPHWNPDYRIFIDYEYWLQCLDLWGQDSFRINPTILVQYVQTNDGVIGRSSYGDWARELRSIVSSGRYAILEDEDLATLDNLVNQWLAREKNNQLVPAFQEAGA